MTQKDETHHPAQKSRNLFIAFAPVFIFGLVLLLDGGTAIGKSKPDVNPALRSSRTLRSMARVYMAYGEYAKAELLTEKALTLAQKNTEDTSDATDASNSELCLCLIDLAYVYNNQGRLSEAESMCVRGLKLQEEILYKNHPYVAYTLRILSSIYRGQGKYRQARAALDRAMVIMLDSHTADDKAMAPFRVDIAKLLVAEGDFEKAETCYQKAMASINNSYGPDHLYTADVLCSIAKLYTLQERYTEAERLINRAVAIQERIYGPDHHLIAPSWMTKAKVCQVKGELAEAERLIKKALAAVEKSGNTAALAKLEQSVKEMRASRQVAYGPIAKATE